MNSMNAANGNTFTVNRRIIALRLANAMPASRPYVWRFQTERRRDQLQDPDDQQEPTPGVEVVEDDEALVADEVGGIVDRRDPPDRVQEPGEHQHDAGEEDPALAALGFGFVATHV